MATVVLSSKFQIVIPKSIRNGLNWKAGERIVLVEKGNSVELVRIGSIKNARGIAKGVSLDNLREDNERFD